MLTALSVALRSTQKAPTPKPYSKAANEKAKAVTRPFEKKFISPLNPKGLVIGAPVLPGARTTGDDDYNPLSAGSPVAEQLEDEALKASMDTIL